MDSSMLVYQGGVSRSTTRILAKPKEDLDPTGKSTKNIVYKDVLNW
jgi:ATP-dependent DNA helicase PIF1